MTEQTPSMGEDDQVGSVVGACVDDEGVDVGSDVGGLDTRGSGDVAGDSVLGQSSKQMKLPSVEVWRGP
ncbi:hypothetical protein [Streptomyces leeuwenhoekii]|uniref:hypothetical protein n=1 Tax=Streptomyces leeuwenhoekii TaxID=1437453 RepID=UPI0012FEE12E|nr:hypothetical protein [Streptomyces leeuwenhoekii]